MQVCRRLGVFVSFFLSSAALLFAGGSGLNVFVVVNQNSTNSVQLGNYYCELLNVTPQNILQNKWTGCKVDWAKTYLENNILNPFLGALSERQLTNQIDYIVLCMDIPYRTSDGSGYNSSTSQLFYGYKADTNYPPGINPE